MCVIYLDYFTNLNNLRQNSEYSDDSKSIQCNLETTCKNEMSTQIRILQQCIKRKNVRINVLKSK